jgi:predicted RNase H-like nuclease (RuvC/YqgF family)
MITSLGGREATIKNARQTCIILGEDEREIIEELKGEGSISECIRDSIKMRSPKHDVTSNQKEIRELKEENTQLIHELERYKRNEHTLTQEREEVAAYIAHDFERYKVNTKRAEDPIVRHRWLASRCRDTGLAPTDIITYISNKF